MYLEGLMLIRVSCAYLGNASKDLKVKRITPRAALMHPFLRDPDEADDDEFAPHCVAEGVCMRYHRIDRRGDHWVYLRDEDGQYYRRRAEAGEAVCIGRRPCEFHQEGYALEIGS